MQRTVLIVDDEQEFTELMSWVLKGYGYAVETAADGAEALQKVQSNHPDAVVLDLMLPELDGTAVCEILRQTPSTAKIPILMVTGCATDTCKQVALNIGVSDYIVKPCSPRNVASRINELLTRE